MGDTKYGDKKLNEVFRRKYGLKYQLLHAYRMEMPQLSGALENLSGKVFYAGLPEIFQNILEGEKC